MGKKSTPKAPDTTAAAIATADANKQATQEQTVANRPNQTDIYGNTSTWSQDPKTGQWTQRQSLSGSSQAMLNQQNQLRSGLMGQAANNLRNPISMAGLPQYSGYDQSKLQGVNTNIGRGVPEMGEMAGSYGPMGQMAGSYGPMGQLANSYGNMGKLQENYGPMGNVGAAGNFNMDPRGNSQAIQDATYKLLSPQREMERNSEIQRLKNQGLTEDSPAFQRAVQRLDQGDTEAQLRSLLAGQQEYGNQFQRGMGQNQQNFGQRLSAAEFANQRQGQLFGQDMSRQGYTDQQQAQRFGQGMARAGYADQQQAQRFGQGMDRAQFANESQAQRFGQGIDRANLADRQNQQQFGQNEAQQRLAMALRGQQWGEQGDQATLNTAQRAAMLGERAGMRQQPLNDLQALMQAQNFNAPQFGQVIGAGNAGGTDYTGAQQSAYQAQLAASNAKNQAASNTTSGLMGLAGSALMVF